MTSPQPNKIPITKIITRRPTADIFYLKFETENSVYKLIKLK